MKLSVICAMAENQVIGRDNHLPWHLSADLQHFKNTTMGHSIIMGRKTWESIGRPLPGRTSIVITTDDKYQAAGARVVHSLPQALTEAASLTGVANTAEVFVIGGAGVYAAALPRAQRLYLTRVHAEVSGDTFLTGFDERQWQEIWRQEYLRDESNPYDYSICLLERMATEVPSL